MQASPASLWTGPAETIQQLLITVDLALVDLLTRLQPVSEDRRTSTTHLSTTHQGRRLSLSRRLHLTARAAENFTQYQTKDVSSRGLRLARSGSSTCLSGYVDLIGT